MSRRHIPESPAHALRRARKIVRHMRAFVEDCLAFAGGRAERRAARDLADAAAKWGADFEEAVDVIASRNATAFSLPPPSSQTPARRGCDPCGDGSSPASETAGKAKGDSRSRTADAEALSRPRPTGRSLA